MAAIDDRAFDAARRSSACATCVDDSCLGPSTGMHRGGGRRPGHPGSSGSTTATWCSWATAPDQRRIWTAETDAPARSPRHLASDKDLTKQPARGRRRAGARGRVRRGPDDALGPPPRRSAARWSSSRTTATTAAACCTNLTTRRDDRGRLRGRARGRQRRHRRASSPGTNTACWSSAVAWVAAAGRDRRGHRRRPLDHHRADRKPDQLRPASRLDRRLSAEPGRASDTATSSISRARASRPTRCRRPAQRVLIQRNGNVAFDVHRRRSSWRRRHCGARRARGRARHRRHRHGRRRYLAPASRSRAARSSRSTPAPAC